jgi:hypothetical protein
MIEEQPNPQIFYKSVLELGMCNLVSVFSMDSRMIKSMLHEKHSKHFKSEYPIFYKIRNYSKSNEDLY